MTGFFETLIHPDREELEMAERTIVGSAANVLQVGEFQFLQLAYREWHDSDMPQALVDRIFSDYMLNNQVPHWARHYARLILTRAEMGTLNDNDPSYHRYDHDYHTHVPHGVQRFWRAVAILSFVMVVCILAAEMAVDEPVSLLPPYFDRKELEPAPRTAEPPPDRRGVPWGRADVVPSDAGKP